MIFLLDDRYPALLPDPEQGDENGMVAISKTLGTERIIAAYKKGIFPWMKMEQEPFYWCWFSPNPRMILVPEKLKISKSLNRVIQKKKFEIKVDHDFTETMRACASAERPKQESTWIEEDMIRDYSKLHSLGIAHSIEAFLDGERVGGLYGLAMEKVFFGESMFSTVSDASKVCLAYLVGLSHQAGVELIDCQVHTSHLESMGGEEIPRKQYLNFLRSLASSSKSVIDWTVFQ